VTTYAVCLWQTSQLSHSESAMAIVQKGKFYRMVFRFNYYNIIAPMIYDGTADSILFEHWFEHMFLKVVPKGSWFVLDNATFHRKPILRELTQRAGCFNEFLPPYSPDLNKSSLRQMQFFYIKRAAKATLFDSILIKKF